MPPNAIAPERLQGAFTALITPFTLAGEVDEPALRALCERQVQAEVGLVPCGTTGETPTLTDAEYALVVRTAVEIAAGRVPVIAGTGSNDTVRTIRTTRLAHELGVDAALVVAPYYNKPPQCSLIAHFQAVADEGGLPVVLYNVPSRTGCKLSAETILALAEHPNIVALKEASADLDLFQDVIFGAPEGFRVLSGDDAWTVPVMLLGAHGVISVASNLVPREIHALCTAVARGDYATARAAQAALLPLFRAIFLTANPIPVKWAAEHLGLCGAGVRLPLTADALTEPMKAELVTCLASVGEDAGGWA